MSVITDNAITVDKVAENAITLSDESTTAIELQFASTDKEGSEDRLGDKKVIWKDILSEGKIEVAPVPGAKKRPFTVIAQGASDPQNLKVSLTDLVDSFRDAAFKYVKIPMGHPRKGVDIAAINTGYAEGVRIVKKNGRHYLQAALGFTEPDVAGKVKRGTIPDVSSGILLNFMRKKDGRTFPAALHHIALTGDPIDSDLEPFKRVYASDEEVEFNGSDVTVIPIEFADTTDTPTDNSDTNKVELVWNEQDGVNWVQQQLQEALNPSPPVSEGVDIALPVQPRPNYYVQDISQTKNLAVVEMYYKGDRSRWLIPFTTADGKVTPSPEFRWTEVKEALVAASEDFGTTSISRVKEGIERALQINFGDEASNYSVDEVSLARQALIRNADGALFLADFAMLSDGQICLAPSNTWEKRADAPVVRTTENEKISAAPAQKKDIQLFDESTPEGRVLAARYRRRQLIK